MKTLQVKAGLLILALGLSTNAVADGHERVVNVWDCTVKDGKTLDDVRAANKKWLAYMNANVEGGDIQSFIMTPIVGKRGRFFFADSYPDLASWSAGENLESDELEAIGAELEEVVDCGENTLHKSEAT